MANDAVTQLIQDLLDKNGEKDQPGNIANYHRQYLDEGIGIALANLSDISQYKAAVDQVDVIDKEIRNLIDEIVAAYPADIIWASKKLQKPIIIRETRKGFYALIPPSFSLLGDIFTLGFIERPSNK